MIDLRGIEDSLALEIFLDKFVELKIVAPFFIWAPKLAGGPVGFVVSFLVTKAVGWIFDKLKEFAGERFIAIARSGLLDGLNEAGSELAVIAIEKGIDSPEFKAARKVHKDALSHFARFGKPTT